ncbi:MAG: peptide/nickel transport system permease protein [Cellvibrionaceae bacterium]|jgi:peptide/nickel transport system permease protein
MVRFIIRRLLVAIPTLLAISLVIFLVLDLAPGDPTGNLPLTVPPEVKEAMREAMGVNEPTWVKYGLWLKQFFIIEPQYIFEDLSGVEIFDYSDKTNNPPPIRIVSWQSRGPVFDTILERLPQTLWVLGLSYIFGAMFAIPVGIITAYRQYSWVDNLGTFFALIGYSVPTFVLGLLFIIVFSVKLGWFPTFYDPLLEVTDWASFIKQIKQIIMPVTVLSFFNAAVISRFMRSSMLDNLNLDYVRTARSKGLTEWSVVMVHVVRNSLIPVITLLALQIPGIFGGAIITEQIFKINGIGQLLIVAIQNSDIPAVQTITFIFAILIVFFNIVADVLYGILDPRIRFD